MSHKRMLHVFLCISAECSQQRKLKSFLLANHSPGCWQSDGQCARWIASKPLKGLFRHLQVEICNASGNLKMRVYCARPFVPWEGCAACWSNDDHRNILLCDGCDLEFHHYCVVPPLPDIPSGACGHYPFRARGCQTYVGGRKSCKEVFFREDALHWSSSGAVLIPPLMCSR